MSNQTKIPTKKNYFWNGVLSVNSSYIEHSLFEITLLKYKSSSGIQTHFLIKDIPPVPIMKREDVFKISIYLENALGNSPQRQLYAEASFSGASFDFNFVGDQTIKTDEGEWKFKKVPSNRYPSGVTPWFLCELEIKMTENKLKQYLSHLNS